VNPEIRFRVQPDIYELADRRAQDLGLAWADDLPKPKEGPLPVTLAPGKTRVTVHHSLSEDYRRQCLDSQGLALPSSATTVLEVDARTAAPEIRRSLRLNEDGHLAGSLHLPEWETEGAVTLQQLGQYLGARNRAAEPGEWQQTLASWAQENGSELLRARLEEGFSWLALAEHDWLRWRIEQAAGETLAFEELRAEQSLAGPNWVHSLYPDREPSLERIQLLRRLRHNCQDIPGLRLTLVKGARERIESRSRSSESPFAALLWQLHTPTGRQLGLLSHFS